MTETSCDYRPCVGIVVLNEDSKIFMAKRLDGARLGWLNSWQLPQGGIDEKEDPATAALRELKEETGIKTVEMLAEIPGWLYYDLPSELVGKIWSGKYKGQKQKWFLVKFTGSDNEINLAQHEYPEFCMWEWVAPNDIINRVVSFKIDVYKQVMSYFSTWFK